MTVAVLIRIDSIARCKIHKVLSIYVEEILSADFTCLENI